MILSRLTWAVAAIVTGFVALATGRLSWELRALPYNEQERYFDPATGVVHHEQAVMVYGALCGAFTLGCALSLWALFRR